MAIEDRETVICFNRADMKEGSPISTQHQPTSVIKFKIGLFVVFRRRGCLLILIATRHGTLQPIAVDKKQTEDADHRAPDLTDMSIEEAEALLSHLGAKKNSENT